MNILCSTDENYVPYCGIMLTSLFENAPKEKMAVYIMTNHLSNDSQHFFDRLSKLYDNDIRLIEVDDNFCKNFPIKQTDHVSLATYYRIFAPLLLPDTVDKILYLDCDVIVNKSYMGGVVDLYKENIAGVAVGAVVDENYFAPEIYDRLQYPSDKLYFNAGMLLINLKYWRERQVMERCLRVIAEQYKSLLFHDQDTLNIVLQDEKKWLPVYCNFQTGFLLTNSHYERIISEEIDKCKFNPLIIHYTGPGKPWYKGSQHPYTSYWISAKSSSLWNHLRLIKRHKTLKEKLRQCLVNIIWTLGIKKRPKTYIITKQNG